MRRAGNPDGRPAVSPGVTEQPSGGSLVRVNAVNPAQRYDIAVDGVTRSAWKPLEHGGVTFPHRTAYGGLCPVSSGADYVTPHRFFTGGAATFPGLAR